MRTIPDWYRFWRKHARFLAIGEATHRERLTTEQAARLFRVGIRTVQRAILFRRQAARLLTPTTWTCSSCSPRRATILTRI